MGISRGLIHDLLEALLNISANTYPTIPNPPGCKKRASVALIIRMRAHPSSRPSPLNYPQNETEDFIEDDRLSRFFSQQWVQQGDPEVLFIKRAARANDRWTSHVALPGGKRDPHDEDDRATAVRETLEEVGLDLNAKSSSYIGNLPERIVTTEWGMVPLVIQTLLKVEQGESGYLTRLSCSGSWFSVLSSSFTSIMIFRR